MPAASFNKFNATVAGFAAAGFNFSADATKVMLTDVAPIATNVSRSDITEIAAGSGYPAGGVTATLVSSGQVGGLYTLKLATATITAAGGSIGPFRYPVVYDAASNLLMGWFDYGSEVTLNAPEFFTVQFDAVSGALQLQ